MEYTVLCRHQGHARRRRRRREGEEEACCREKTGTCPPPSFNFIHKSQQPTSPSRDRPFSPQAPLFFSSTTTTTSLPLIDIISRLINQSFNKPLHSILPFLSIASFSPSPPPIARPLISIPLRHTRHIPHYHHYHHRRLRLSLLLPLLHHLSDNSIFI